MRIVVKDRSVHAFSPTTNLKGRNFPRTELADILQKYNQSIGNDAAALAQIQSFRKADSTCIVTGQQAGLFGGPAYTILKAISCVILARATGSVPVFWLASEDHDVDEVDHTYLLDAIGNLRKYHLALPKDGRFVEELQITPDHLKLIEGFHQAAGVTISQSNHSYSHFMARHLAHLFRGTGLVILEPYLLRRLAKPFFKKEIEACDEIHSVLKHASDKIRQAGDKPQLQIDNGSNLFLKMHGVYRRKIRRERDVFLVGHEKFSEKDLLELIEDQPERFSVNAAARCVLQNSLFPLLAYVAGPAEIAYYRQLEEYHQLHHVPVPQLVPRLSASFITPQGEEMLRKCELEPWEQLPVRWLDAKPELGADVKELASEWLKTLDASIETEMTTSEKATFVRFMAKKMQRKLVRLRLKQQGIPLNSLHYLNNLLHPHQKLQERVLNWWEFQRHTEENLVQTLLTQTDLSVRGHHYCYL